MMRPILFVVTLLTCTSALAAQCRVDVKNEVHINSEHVEIHRADGQIATMTANNQLSIDGKSVPLDSEQASAMERFRQSMSDSVPRVKQVINDGLVMADSVIDDISTSLGKPGAFDNLKQGVRSYAQEWESRYYKNGELVLPASSYEQMQQEWMAEFDKAKVFFSREFMTSAFDTIAKSMKQEGGFNLTQLNDVMAKLKTSMAEHLKAHQKQMDKQRDELCDSLDNMVEQEKSLHKKIPQLKDYQVFTI